MLIWDASRNFCKAVANSLRRPLSTPFSSKSREFMEKVETTARSVEGVLGVLDLKAEYVEPNIIHTGFHIEIARGTPIEEADRIAHEVEARVSRETGCQHCVIHVDPVGDSPRQG